jgi:hypothetical protein
VYTCIYTVHLATVVNITRVKVTTTENSLHIFAAMLTEVFLLALLVSLVYFLLFRRVQHGKPLKGPTGYPLVGNILDVDVETFHLKATEWSRIYGDIFAINVVGREMIIFNTSAVIRDALLSKPHDAIFASRPPMFWGETLNA